jgi:adenylate cyclase class IV
MNFKGVQTLWEKSRKFSKILSQLGFHKSEFSLAHLYARFWSSNTSAKRLDLKKIRKEFELKFNPNNTYNATQTILGFHSSFQIT